MKVETFFGTPFVSGTEINDSMPYVVYNGKEYAPLKESLEESLEISLADVWINGKNVVCQCKQPELLDRDIHNISLMGYEWRLRVIQCEDYTCSLTIIFVNAVEENSMLIDKLNKDLNDALGV